MVYAQQVERRGLTDLVLEVGEQQVPIPLLDESNEVSQLLADLLQHHDGDVLPPFLGLELLQDHELLPHHRDVGLFFEHRGDRDDLIPQLAEPRIVPQHGKLQVEHQEVKALGLLLFRLNVRGKRYDLRRQLVEVILPQHSPCLCFGEALDVLPFRAHDEVIEVHGGHDAVQE